MFFRKKEADPRTASQRTPGVVETQAGAQPVSPGGHGASGGDAQTTMVLDALGGVITALARFPVDLPHRPAAETTKEMTTWQRHATMGLPIEGGEEGGASVGIGDRDWRGLVRAVASLRRDEQSSVDALVSELRTALWSCVSAVHEAVRIDDNAEAQTGTHLSLVKKAFNGTTMSTIKDDVLKAVSEIDRTIKERREEQQRQYKTLATSIDALGRQLEEAARIGARAPPCEFIEK